jgi:hypothetical protein
MSSETSTEGHAFRPWHFFVVGALLAATAGVLLSPRSSPEQLILFSITIFAGGLAGYAFLRTLLPFAGVLQRSAWRAKGTETRRSVLEREKQFVLRSIKELEFDRALGKVAEEDFNRLSRRLRSRAMRLMRDLDEAVHEPRARIEREVAERLGIGDEEIRVQGSGFRDHDHADPGTGTEDRVPESDVRRQSPAASPCPVCGTANDADARFCKQCGSRMSE